MNPIFYIIITLGAVSLFAFIFYLILKKQIKQLSEENKVEDKSILMLNQNIQEMQKSLNERLDNAARAVSAVNKELGQVQEMGRNMKNLQDFLRSPKLRGNIGEQILKDLLSQYFPQQHFDLQFKFKTGQMVDAILKTDQGLISIDSKFPLENFQKMAQSEVEAERAVFLREFTKDVRKHVRDISRKYILPEEDTVDFAIMYVPSEAIYYEIIRSEEDIQLYAQENKVLIVSPNSFFYFLKVILMGLQGKRIEETAKKVLTAFQAMAKDNEKIGNELGILNTHLTNASGAMDRLNSTYNSLSNKMDQVNLLE